MKMKLTKYAYFGKNTGYFYFTIDWSFQIFKRRYNIQIWRD